MKLHLLTASLLASLALTACQQDTAADTAMTEPTPAATDTMAPADTMAAPDAVADAPAAASGDVVDGAIASPDHTTLVAAVQAAGLVDTLKGTGPFTVFAPTNDAFAKLPKKDLDAVLNDKAMLTKVLTNHVVAGRLDPMQLAGTHDTLAKTELKVTGSGEVFMVGDAKVVCGNVQTMNATVYIIDSVLLPKM